MNIFAYRRAVWKLCVEGNCIFDSPDMVIYCVRCGGWRRLESTRNLYKQRQSMLALTPPSRMGEWIDYFTTCTRSRLAKYYWIQIDVNAQAPSQHLQFIEVQLWECKPHSFTWTNLHMKDLKSPRNSQLAVDGVGAVGYEVRSNTGPVAGSTISNHGFWYKVIVKSDTT